MDIREFSPVGDAEGEEWRSIPGYETTYAVSSHGRVYSRPRPRTKGGLRSVRVGKRGYPCLTLVQDGVQKTHEVHRLVAAAFLGPRPAGYEVRHLDGQPLNCHVGNLAYGTITENALDKRDHGTDRNAAKTHCPQGHAYEGDNVLRIPSRPNARYCRTCNVAQKSARYYQQKWAA